MDMRTERVTTRYSVRDTFGIDVDMDVMGYPHPTQDVPEIDMAYQFNPEVTLAILAGFTHNRRTLIQGRHGTGKSTHIEQVAARLNWPCMRINLDGHLSRLDLVGKDAIVLKDGKQVTEFQEGILPWAVQKPMALILDEYDAGRPDIMFVIQRLLEKEGKLALMEQNRVITPHPQFRLFATANTVGLGNVNGLYHGTQVLNHAQLDRWNLTATLNYLPAEQEAQIVLARVPEKNTPQGKTIVDHMVQLANLTRQGFETGDLSSLMSPRTVMTWAENCEIFKDCELAFKLTFFNKCEESEQALLEEYYQRCFGRELLNQELPEQESLGSMRNDE
ncbi:AAA family ATPase [Vibrio penaeicida]|uniref:AAA family ATPase n=1 Tax=Vibrio penaeicida TaxID=104609 RepID=UPI000CEA716A|nr:AAA family ATPase [Vibrio penaeicida]